MGSKRLIKLALVGLLCFLPSLAQEYNVPFNPQPVAGGGLTCRTSDVEEDFSGTNAANTDNWDGTTSSVFVGTGVDLIERNPSAGYTSDCSASTNATDGNFWVDEECALDVNGDDTDSPYIRHDATTAWTACADPSNCNRQVSLLFDIEDVTGLDSGEGLMLLEVRGDDICPGGASDQWFLMMLENVGGTITLRLCTDTDCGDQVDYNTAADECFLVQLDMTSNSAASETVDYEIFDLGTGCGAPSGSPDASGTITWAQSSARDGLCRVHFGLHGEDEAGVGTTTNVGINIGGIWVDNGSGQICQ